jgi:indolepyruvate ferredoxin oxidoreductase beta subunit
MTVKLDIVVAGVGGQGSLSASTFLGEAAARAGLEVVAGEIHGMSQRGGIVTSTVRIGRLCGPIVSLGSAEVLLGFEPVEAWRAVDAVSDETLVVVNTRPIVPPNVSMKGEAYPDPGAVVEELRQVAGRVIALDASAVAAEAGNPQAVGSVLLGVLAGTGILPFDDRLLLGVILENVPERAVDANRRAFERGLELGRSHRA